MGRDFGVNGSTISHDVCLRRYWELIPGVWCRVHTNPVPKALGYADYEGNTQRSGMDSSAHDKARA